MKRIISLILCAVMVIPLALSVSAREWLNNGNEFINDDTYVLGDVNGDGEQNGRDALAIKATVAGLEGYSLIEDAADFNGDGTVDAKDSYLMKTCLSGASSFEELEGEYQIYNLTIAGNPISEYSIVLPDIENIDDYNSSYAAKELRTYIEIATGVKLETYKGEAPTPHVIRFHQYFVDTPENIEMGLEIENYKYDVTDGDLNIYGSLRGNMYAVYEILEDILGFRFVSGEYTFVYKNRTVDIPEGTDVFFETAINHRYASHTFTENWYKLNNYHFPRRMNGPVDNTTAGDRRGGMTGHHYMFSHSFAYCWQMGTGEVVDESQGTLVERLNHKFATGEVHSTLTWQPCCTNEKVYQTMFSGLVDICRMITLWGDGAVHKFRLYEEYATSCMYFSIEDNGNHCTCRNCRKLANKEGYSGNYLSIANRAAVEIQEYFPGLKIALCMYDHTVPETVRPDKNIILSYACPACNNHALGSGECGDGLTYLGDSNDNCCTHTLKAWGEICKETGAEIWIYYYPITYGWFTISCPNIIEIYYDYTYMINECNVTGIYYEGGGETYNFETLKAYLASLVMWDPDMTLDEYIEHMKEYLYIWYGDGYEYIYEYIMLLQEAGDANGCFINNHNRPFDFYNYEYIRDNYETMRETLLPALELADRPECKERIETLIINCDFLGLSAVHYSWYKAGTEETKALYMERYTNMYNYYVENDIDISGHHYELPNTIDFESNPCVQWYDRMSWRWPMYYAPEY